MSDIQTSCLCRLTSAIRHQTSDITPLTFDHLILIGIILAIGSTLQSAVGFGSGLFSIPLIVWVGVPLPQTIVIALVSSMTQATWGCIRHHEHLDWRPALGLAVLRIAMLPVGIVLLAMLVSVGQERVKQVIGAALLTILFVQWLFRVKPREHVALGWGLLAGTSSGVLAGMVGMGGPPIVLWVMAHDWPSHKARTFLWCTFLMTMPISLGLYYLWFGSPILHAALVGLIFIPLTLIGSTLGLWLGGLMSRQRLRVAMLAMLIFVALASMVGPMWHSLWR